MSDAIAIRECGRSVRFRRRDEAASRGAGDPSRRKNLPERQAGADAVSLTLMFSLVDTWPCIDVDARIAHRVIQ
jgi:hypothetical protein